MDGTMAITTAQRARDTVAVSPSSARWIRRVEPYLYVIPAALFVAAFLLYPVVVTVWQSLTHDDGITPAVFVGLQNFADLFADAHFLVSLQNTIIWTVAAV